SSRRRHTSFSRDWSSDVCSSDLPLEISQQHNGSLFITTSKVLPSFSLSHRLHPAGSCRLTRASTVHHIHRHARACFVWLSLVRRSEERRVGKESATRLAASLRTE